MSGIAVSEIDNEVLVEVGEAEEGLDLFHISRDKPFGDGICFGDVHRNT